MAFEQQPKMLAFDLDGTLACSKMPMHIDIAGLLAKALQSYPLAIVTGGSFALVKHQIIDPIAKVEVKDTNLEWMTLVTGSGAQFWYYINSLWQPGIQRQLSINDKHSASYWLEKEARKLGFWYEQVYGPVLEDRGGQITFSALGQQAPIKEKQQWDPTGQKRQALRDAVALHLPNLQVVVGGLTSVDVFAPDLNKGSAIKTLAKQYCVKVEEILYFGDRLQPGGNDYPVIITGAQICAVNSWEDTYKILETIV